MDDFNIVFGDIDWGDGDGHTAREQVIQVVKEMQKSDDVRDAILNNDEETQSQVVHEVFSRELGTITANSSELHRIYLSQPSRQESIENLVLMRLQQQINPDFNEALLTEKLMDEFAADFRELRGYRPLSEAVEWMFKVLDTPSGVSRLDGISRLKRIINLVYCTNGRAEDKQEWLTVLIGRFEAYLKKMYYMQEHRELTKPDGGLVQFLDAARALHINHLHFTDTPELQNFRTFYDFLHAQRNAESHGAPEVSDTEVPVGIHMAMAVYLYATLVNITDLEAGEAVGETQYMMAAEPEP